MDKLVKGQKIKLTKKLFDSASIRFGLGWDMSGSSPACFDLDFLTLLADQ